MTTTLEFMVPKADSELFNTAVYQFLEREHGGLTDDSAMLITEPHGPVHRKRITLWSEDAMLNFVSFWSGVRRPSSRTPMLMQSTYSF